MENTKAFIENKLTEMKLKNEDAFARLDDICYLTDYTPENDIWTGAFQDAINEHSTVIIPPSDKPYIIDKAVIIPSNRRIIAKDGAVIRLKEGVTTLMLRNASTADGTHMPISTPRDKCISIEGGVWEDWCPHRMGYGRSGMYDEKRSLYGVSTLMFLENVDCLTIKNMTFKHCGGFAVQIGDASDVVAEGIRFEGCYADGLHINGNVENVYVSDVRGEVGDDLVAFNMFDWQDSSVNFGPCKNVLCQDLELAESSHYKALRIEPGVYEFKDGSCVDCSLENAIFRRIKGIKTFKLYCQTPPYSPDKGPEKADVGSGDNIFFEDISIDLDSPIDKLDEYMTSHPVKGTFAAFELGLNVKNIYFKNIDLTLHRDIFPMSYLICIGPKSVRFPDGREVFDPYFSSTAESIYLENIRINGEKPHNVYDFIKEIEFNSLYDDIPSTAYGRIKSICVK